jgi:murein DD-endopeptidase MepM/ murein hydrolase activator NlpD
MKNKWILVTVLLVSMLTLMALKTRTVRAQDGGLTETAVALETVQPQVALSDTSQEIYRFPYRDGVTVRVIQDFHGEHPGVDLAGISGSNHEQIIAASGGWVREIVDDRDNICDSGDYEHGNYILMEHPNNDEWVHYFHIKPHSAQVSEGDYVSEGTIIAEQAGAGDTCSEHLHFAVSVGRDGEFREPRFCNVDGGTVQSGDEYTVVPCDRTAPSISFNTPAQNRWYNTNQTLSWVIRDSGSGVDYFKWEWNDSSPDDRVDDDRGSTTLSAAGEGIHTLYVQAWDNVGNRTPVQSRGWFGYDTSAPSVSINVGPGGWITQNQVTFSWSGSDNLTPNSELRFHYRIVGVTNWSPLLSGTSCTLSNIPDGEQRFEVQAYDLAENESVVAFQSFGVDTRVPSNPTWVNSGCSATHNIWQNTCNDPRFVWSGADDHEGSGVRDYRVYWGTDPDGDPSQVVSVPVYDPAPVPDGSIYYLRISTRDGLSQESAPMTLFVLRYDAVPPSVTLDIENGASIVNQVTTRLELKASDDASGLDRMRFSNNNLVWSHWQPCASTTQWELPALDGRTLPVYVQVKDRTGNVAQASDAVTLDLYTPLPVSQNYRLCSRTMNVTGGVSNSPGYAMISSMGAAWGESSSSDAFDHDGGFPGAWDGCWTPLADTIDYTLTRSVVAAGGRLRGSDNYRSGDTIGQPWSSSAQPMTSARLTLSSGFWAREAGEPLPAPPEPAPWLIPTPNPTPAPFPDPTPTPTPLPGVFGTTINDGMLFTNKREVTLTLSGPGMAQMQISNDSGFQGALWETYQSTRSWIIGTCDTNVNSCYVYVRFRDANGTVYGNFVDDIIYDQEAPEGRGTLSGTIFLLWAWDDGSGVSAVRYAASREVLADQAWQPYTGMITLDGTTIGPAVYVQFRDQAGNSSKVYNIRETYEIYLPMILR